MNIKRNTMLRQFAALNYDLFILLALEMLAVLPINMLFAEAIPAGTWWFQLYVLSIGIFFFGWFWVKGGQTIGMRAWRLKLISNEPSQAISWKQAVIRGLIAIPAWLAMACGFFWQLIPPNKSWQDFASKTEIIYFTDKE